MNVLRVVAAVVLVGVVPGCKKDSPPTGEGSGTGAGRPVEAKPSGATAKAPDGCNSDFAQPLQTDWTLTESCSPYTLKGELAIDGFALTIEPGVELRVAEGGNVWVGYQKTGKLIARGTAEKPVRLVAADRKEPGSWSGLTLYADAAACVLEHVIIEHAGRGDVPAVAIKSGGHSLKGLKVSAVKAAALQIDSEAPLAELTGIDLSGAGATEVAMASSLNALGTLAFTGTFDARQVIALRGNVQRDVTLAAQTAPYRLVDSVSVDGVDGKAAILRAGPGVTLQLGENAAIDVGYNRDQAGGLEFVGSAEKPVRLTRFGDGGKDSPAKGLHFYGGARPARLEDVSFEAIGQKDGAAVTWDGTKKPGTVKRVSVRDTQGHGFLVLAGAFAPFAAFEDNRVAGAGQSALSAPLRVLHQLGASNALGPRVEINQGTLGEDVTLSALGVPYRAKTELNLEGAEEGKAATLTLEPGVTLELSAASPVSVGYAQTGALIAKGTPGKSVTFKPIEGTFPGVHVYAKGTITLENVAISGGPADAAALILDAAAQGALSAVTFDSAIGVRNCSKATVGAVKARPGQKAQTQEGC